MEHGVTDRKQVSYTGNVVVLIESVHLLEKEFSGSLVQFWFPKVLPSRIKFICTVKPDSNACNYFRKNANAQLLDLEDLEETVKLKKIEAFFESFGEASSIENMMVGDNS